MAHTCAGEYCIISGSWSCPNRLGRVEADVRSPEEIKRAQEIAKAMWDAAVTEFNSSLEEYYKQRKQARVQSVKTKIAGKNKQGY